MTYNLITAKWLPVRRADNTRDHIAPWQLTERDNPPISLDAPRPDFNGALIQLLIGLVQTAFAPEDDDAWFEHFEQPPTPKALRAAFEPFHDAFNLDGDGPRFMQDLDPLKDQKPLPITALLIDTAGSETHFVKDLPQQGVSPAMAAMALFTLQTNAPSGGVGHRTSLRGGGPLTTLVTGTQMDGHPDSLWHGVWLNILEKTDFENHHEEPKDIFPWLTDTRISDKGIKTTQEDVSPLQMFWGMPRRIRLDFDSTVNGECGLSGEHGVPLVRQYRTKNYGTNYPAETWHHTLSPYTKDPKQSLPMHPRGSINYRHWLGLTQPSEDKKSQKIPADVVRTFNARARELEGRQFRLRAFGYDLDNMKPRCWYESTFPLFPLPEPADREALEKAAQSMVKAAGEFFGNLRSCLLDAWFASRDPRRKGADTGFLDNAFWQDTEDRFYESLFILSANPADPENRESQFEGWHSYLGNYTLSTFDCWADANQIGDQSHPERTAKARHNLRVFKK